MNTPDPRGTVLKKKSACIVGAGLLVAGVMTAHAPQCFAAKAPTSHHSFFESVATGVYDFLKPGLAVLGRIIDSPREASPQDSDRVSSKTLTSSVANTTEDVDQYSDNVSSFVTESPSSPGALSVTGTETSQPERIIERAPLSLTIISSGLSNEEVTNILDARIADLEKRFTVTGSANLHSFQLVGAPQHIDTLSNVTLYGATITNATVTGTLTGNIFAAGSYLELASAAAPSTATNRLYNMAGVLYWNGSPVGSSSSGLWVTDDTNIWRTSGRVGVGDATPDHLLDIAGNIGLDSSSYIQFGDTDGTLGYGIRDNAGVIEYKNNGGIWTSLAGIGGGMAIGGTVTSATQGSVFFSGAGGVLSQDNSGFFYDVSNHRLGISTTTPGQTLTVDGTFGILEGGSTPSFHTIFQGGDQAANITYTLPTASVNGLLRNTGGILSWDATGYLTSYTETDPVFAASSANGITGTNITNWNTAYGWGNHASAGYLAASAYTAADVLAKLLTVDGTTSTLDADTLDGHDTGYFYAASNPSGYITDGNAGWDNSYGFITSYTETDPVFAVSSANGITGTNITNWNTAYGWGNHASAGYITDGNTGWDNSYGFITDANDSVSASELDGTFTTNGILTRTGAATYATITNNSSNWNTAYGWGNHASAGYLAASAYTAADVLAKLLTVDGTTSTLDADTLDGHDTAYFQAALTNPVTGTGSAGHVPYWSSSSALTYDSDGNYYWDATGNRLGVGTTSPGYTLDVAGSARFTGSSGSSSTVSESFEDVTFPPSGWTTGGNVNWARTTAEYQDGLASAGNGDISDIQTSWIDYDYTAVGGGTITFYWKVSSESGYDYLLFCVNNDSCTSSTGYTNRISGTVAWTQVTYNIPVSGSYSFRWKYIKDSSTSGGSDMGWIDNVSIQTTTPATAIYASGSALFDASAYINWGGTGGAGGYGFRDNGGTLQFKNSAGDWASLGSSLSIGNTITSVTNGSVLFADSSGNLAQDNPYFFYDYTNHRLGLGETSPEGVLDIYSSTAANTSLYITNGNAGNYNPQIGFQLADGTTNIFTMGVDDSDSDKFKISGGSALGTNDRFVIDSSGNVGIGATAPGQKLTVDGTFGILEGGSTPTYHTIFQGGDQAGDLTYTLPTSSADGLLKNTAGVLSWDTSTYPSGTGSSGHVPYWSSSSALTYDSDGNFFWNATDNRLILGATSGTQQLTLTGSIALPATTSSTTGVVYKGSNRFIHDFTASGTNGGNFFAGTNAGNFTMSGTGASASYNTGLGSETLFSLTSGTDNTASGYGALRTNNSGSYNSAYGYQSLYSNTTSWYNSAFGMNALYSNTNGGANVAMGNNALQYTSTGSNNAAVGYAAGRGTAASSNVTDNVFLGYQAGLAVLTGADKNVLVGSGAGDHVTTGANNIALGYQAGNNLTTGGANILIGYDVDAQSATGSSQLSIGNLIFATGGFGTGTTVGTGNVGIGATAPGQKLTVDGTFGILEGGSTPSYHTIFQGGDQSGDITYTLPT
ncbi:MAG: hypothetical protein HGA67_01110, partial [Candidatus Yonathbacteria bacterium]|nr:hypothetical protein [Candidatus Yonathbacteria bacterium]